MKEKNSRGLKRDQLFRVNASGRNQNKREDNPNRPKQKKIQGKTIFLRRDGCLQRRERHARRRGYLIRTN
jgi:hypothetical protein